MPTLDQRRRQLLERDLRAAALFPECANPEAVAYLVEELARLDDASSSTRRASARPTSRNQRTGF